MRESEQQKQSSSTVNQREEIYSTLKTSWQDKTFCRGNCEEVHSLEELCLACRIEWDEWSNNK